MLNKYDIFYNKFILLLHLLFENNKDELDLKSCLYPCKKFIDNNNNNKDDSYKTKNRN